MTEKIIITLIIVVGELIALIVGGLIWLAVTHDGNTEAEVVIALIGFISAIVTPAATLLGHTLGAKAVNDALPAPAIAPQP